MPRRELEITSGYVGDEKVAIGNLREKRRAKVKMNGVNVGNTKKISGSEFRPRHRNGSKKIFICVTWFWFGGDTDWALYDVGPTQQEEEQKQKKVGNTMSSSNLRDLQRELENKANDLSKLQKEIAKNHQMRKKYTIQLGENELVLKELDLLKEDANVYKLIGPVLVKQDLAEANANVRKRIEYISAEFKSAKIETTPPTLDTLSSMWKGSNLETAKQLNCTILPSLVLLYGSSPALPWNFGSNWVIFGFNSKLQPLEHVESGYTEAGSLHLGLSASFKFSLTLQVYVSQINWFWFNRLDSLVNRKRLDATVQDLEEKQNSKKDTILKLQQRIQSLQSGKGKA
ncbi:hypothetical protein V8G54_001896 [Vigna mungo]|uniref:Prefoldin subunit 6 n=1 Tax=Vigna mungo TaxID=3915 RepID=A0AAQ3P9G4_VIGMU